MGNDIKKIEQQWTELVEQYNERDISLELLDHLGTELLLKLDAIDIQSSFDPELERTKRRELISAIYSYIDMQG